MHVASLAPGPSIAFVCLLITFLCNVAYQYHPEPALRLLGLGSFSGAVGIPLVMIRPPVPELISITLGNSLVLLALALFWQATTRLYGRKLSRLGLAAPIGLWLALCAIGPFRHALDLRVEIAMSLAMVLVYLALRQLAVVPWETRTHRPLFVIGGFHFACCGLRGLLTAFPVAGLESVASSVIPFEMLAYVILWPGLMLTLVAERAVLQARAMALVDDMTGAMNRRGFWQAAETLRQRGVLLFDLDHFKDINDTFGHASGDFVIRYFTTVAAGVLGPDAIFARIGGEEFAAAVSGLSRQSLHALAERVRLAFAQATPSPGLRATVSVGFAAPASPDLPLDEQMALADSALYRAKRLGRNRVEEAFGGDSATPATGSGEQAPPTHDLRIALPPDRTGAR
jgi:diguanylate cyclase (GGDEF)-like protein